MTVIPMTTDVPHQLIVITGPTAVGKTSLTIQIARHFFTEIISADSRQFYKEMRIGTARPSKTEMKAVPHHFIGHLSIHDPYNVSRFENDALSKLEDLFSKHHIVLLTGGAGLYINAVCSGIDELPDPDDSLREGLKELYLKGGIAALLDRLKDLDPDYYRTVDRANPKRLMRALEVCITTGQTYTSLRKNKPKPRDFRVIKIGLFRDKEDLAKRISDRTDAMMAEGLLDEVKSLYPFRHLNALNTVGYKELFQCIDKEITLSQAVEKIKTNTRRYAKRQMTWFRKDEDIRWFHADDVEGISRMLDAGCWMLDAG